MKSPYALVFDLGNVLLPINLDKTYEAFASYSNAFNAAEIKQITADEGLWVNYESGIQTDFEFQKSISDRFNLSCNSTQFQVAFNALLLGFDQDTCQYIRSLQSSFPLFLLSNTSKIHSDVFLNPTFPNFNVFDAFQQIHFSFEMGLVKPNQAIYQQVVQQNQLENHQIVFFDDNFSNIESAKEFGWDAVLINPSTAFTQIQHHIQNLC
jgi:putative hydrolase of the HAD superfamily